MVVLANSYVFLWIASMILAMAVTAACGVPAAMAAWMASIVFFACHRLVFQAAADGVGKSLQEMFPDGKLEAFNWIHLLHARMSFACEFEEGIELAYRFELKRSLMRYAGKNSDCRDKYATKSYWTSYVIASDLSRTRASDVDDLESGRELLTLMRPMLTVKAGEWRRFLSKDKSVGVTGCLMLDEDEVRDAVFSLFDMGFHRIRFRDGMTIVDCSSTLMEADAVAQAMEYVDAIGRVRREYGERMGFDPLDPEAVAAAQEEGACVSEAVSDEDLYGDDADDDGPSGGEGRLALSDGDDGRPLDGEDEPARTSRHGRHG